MGTVLDEIERERVRSAVRGSMQVTIIPGLDEAVGQPRSKTSASAVERLVENVAWRMRA